MCSTRSTTRCWMPWARPALPPPRAGRPPGSVNPPAGLLPDHGRQSLPPGRRKSLPPRALPGPARLEHRAAGARPGGGQRADLFLPDQALRVRGPGPGTAHPPPRLPPDNPPKQPVLQEDATGWKMAVSPGKVTPCTLAGGQSVPDLCPGGSEKTPSPESAPRPFVPAIPPEQLGGAGPDRPGDGGGPLAHCRRGAEYLRHLRGRPRAGSVWLIDKHAAHERMNFDKLKNAQEPPMRQTLLAPVAAELREGGRRAAAGEPAAAGAAGLCLRGFRRRGRAGAGGPGGPGRRRHGAHSGGVCRAPADRKIPGGKTPGAAAYHGLQGLHQGRLEERPGGAAGAGGQGTERGGPLLPPWPPGGGEADEVRAGKNVQAGVRLRRPWTSDVGHWCAARGAQVNGFSAGTRPAEND